MHSYNEYTRRNQHKFLAEGKNKASKPNDYLSASDDNDEQNYAEAEDDLLALLRSINYESKEKDKSAANLKFRRSCDIQKNRMHFSMQNDKAVVERVVVVPEEYRDEDLAIVSEADELHEEE